MAKRKCANGGKETSPQSMKDQLMALRPGYAAGGMPDQVAAFQGRIAPLGVATDATAPNALPGINAQSLAASGSLVQLGGGAADSGQAVAAPATPGNVFHNPSAGNMLAAQGTPGLQTMVEKMAASGINPNAAYRPGSAQDPHASGLSGVTAAQRAAGSNASAAALAPNQSAPQIENPMDTTSSRQRRQTRTPGLKDGGAVYRNGDTFSDRPMTGVVGSVSRDPVATAPKPVQQIARPIYPQERQAAPQEQEQRGQGMTSAADLGAMLANRRRQINQNSGMADGGMVRHRFEGKGGPRDDQIPVTVAGEKIKVSDGEEAVILPAKTAQNPQAVAQISDVIQQSNDGRPPAMGMSQGGKYQTGAVNRYPYDGKTPPTAQDVYAPVDIGGMARAAFPATSAAIQEGSANMRKAYDAGNYGAMLGHAGREIVSGGAGLLSDIGNSAAYALNPPANALKTFVTGDSTPASVSGMARAASQAPAMNRLGSANVRGDNAAPIEQPNPQVAKTTGNANGATFDQDTGNLYFTEKGYDPTKQAMAAGTGAITDPKTGRTIMITGAGVPENPNAPRDRYGNDMTQTLALRDELTRARADNALSNLGATNPAYHQKGAAQLQALAGISAFDNAAVTRIASRQKQRRDDASEALLQQKTSGDVADSAQQRAVRGGLLAALQSGDQEAISNAKMAAVAYGILKPGDPPSYNITTDPMGNQTRLNKSTGAAETLDRQTNTWKPIGVAEQMQVFASRAEAEAAQRAGKIKPGQNVMVDGRLMIVTP